MCRCAESVEDGSSRKIDHAFKISEKGAQICWAEFSCGREFCATNYGSSQKDVHAVEMSSLGRSHCCAEFLSLREFCATTARPARTTDRLG
jgi:hypothetical protein